MGNSYFSIGDTVYIIGRYAFEEYNPLMVVTAKIDHLSEGYYIAYGIDGDECTYRFTDSRYGVYVFKDKDLALSVLERYK